MLGRVSVAKVGATDGRWPIETQIGNERVSVMAGVIRDENIETSVDIPGFEGLAQYEMSSRRSAGTGFPPPDPHLANAIEKGGPEHVPLIRLPRIRWPWRRK